MAGLFSRILIANRGEIAVRIARTCRRLGVPTVVACSEADARSLAALSADEAVVIGPAPAAQSYLDMDRVLAAARATGADAIHPGVGFLSERADFARRCRTEGIVFIGPNPEAIEAMGDKIAAKRCAVRAGAPVAPGGLDEVPDAENAASAAAMAGYPVMLKAAAGGGGKGIRVVHDEAELRDAFPVVKAEALGAFGDARVFVERFISSPRHVEVQVLGDRHGRVVHLFERECSIQRRNQKVVEEAPSPLLDGDTRAAMGAQAVALARAVGYDSVGTVEFVASPDREFFFLEMNTRLQVEHPVTEMVTGIDLVEQMIRVAAGEPLGMRQEDVTVRGWAVESRVYAEDPERGFLPSTGRLVRYREPEAGQRDGARIRVDPGVREGDEATVFYDPLLAKLSAWAPTRGEAVDAMAHALEELHVEGVSCNAAFLSAVMDRPRFRAGELSTRFIADEFPDGFRGLEPTPFQLDLFTATAVFMHRLEEARRGASRRLDWVVRTGDAYGRPVRLVEATPGELVVELAEEARTLRLSACDWRPGRPLFRGRLDGHGFAAPVAPLAEGYAVRHRAARAEVRVLTPLAAELHARLPPKAASPAPKRINSPMPGLVVSVHVEPGREVKAGDPVAVIEAMKMQNTIRAERDGVVTAVGPRPGDIVAADDLLAELR